MTNSGGRWLPHDTRDLLKWELAARQGIAGEVVQKGWGEISSRDCGRVGGPIGGNMVKVMLQQAEALLAQQAEAGVPERRS